MRPRMFGEASLPLFQSAFNQLPNCPFFIKDRALRYVAANEAMLQLCGVPNREQLIGRSAQDFFSPSVARQYEALDRHVLGIGQPLKDQLELSRRRCARPTWLLFARIPVHDDTGEVIGVLGSCRRLKAAEADDPRCKRMAVIIRYIQSQYKMPLNLRRLAAQANTSPSQLERDFANVLSVSPREFLIRTRIEQALRLLQTDAAISHVAQECGYADQSGFTRRFKAAMGITPMRYRGLLTEMFAD